MELTLTPKQILQIYKAGIERGKEEYAAYDWGSTPDGEKLDELENCLIWGPGSILDMVGYDEKVEWWKEFKNEIG